MIICTKSLSARRAWIEIVIRMPIGCVYMWSLSARRAWIEIACSGYFCFSWLVALRKESVDRNEIIWLKGKLYGRVALRKESVDRNYKCAFFYFFEAIVALRKESVDRNRRKVLGFPCKQFRVALRKESVDRNNSYPIKYLSS